MITKFNKKDIYLVDNIECKYVAHDDKQVIVRLIETSQLATTSYDKIREKPLPVEDRVKNALKRYQYIQLKVIVVLIT